MRSCSTGSMPKKNKLKKRPFITELIQKVLDEAEGAGDEAAPTDDAE